MPEFTFTGDYMVTRFRLLPAGTYTFAAERVAYRTVHGLWVMGAQRVDVEHTMVATLRSLYRFQLGYGVEYPVPADRYEASLLDQLILGALELVPADLVSTPDMLWTVIHELNEQDGELSLYASWVQPDQPPQDEHARVLRENSCLRSVLAESNTPCVYCGLHNMVACTRGFPGCAQADDIICGEDEHARDMVRRIRELEQELETLKANQACQK